jgi:hypothetical protein
LDEDEGEEMKPSHLIQKLCKTNKSRLKCCYSLIDYFLGEQEVRWAIEVQKKNIKRSVSKK